MSYENAPATRLVATHCVACGRPLVDAVSVEAGMGPDCREKYGHLGPEGATEEARRDVNWRVVELAAGVDVAVRIGHLLIIRAHGFEKLATKLEERLCAVRISTAERPTGAPMNGVVAVEAPFNEAFTAVVKTIAWRRWDNENKRWLVSADDYSKKKLWRAVRDHFAGGIAVLPSGDLMAIDPVQSVTNRGDA
jgi:hypothetical protein